MLTDSNFEMVFGFRSIGFRVYTKKIQRKCAKLIFTVRNIWEIFSHYLVLAVALDNSLSLRTVGMSSNYYNRY